MFKEYLGLDKTATGIYIAKVTPGSTGAHILKKGEILLSVNGLTIDDNGYPYGFNHYDWGASIDIVTTDNMYHQFSCSKCHNPHASRLPKLMITNCLDIRHNTWDDSNSSLQNTFTASALDVVDRNQRAAYYASAQNCHRFDPARTGVERGGWNQVTPWVKSNFDNSEHKGASDTSYGDTSPTYHKFPTESTGW